QNDLFRAENDKIKQHYKELYDSIKIIHAKHIEQVTKLTTENVNLKTCVSKATVNPQVSTGDKHAIDVEPIVPRLRNNRNAHLDYLRHLKESVETIRDIVEEAKVVRPRDRSIVSAYRYTKHSQELLEYAIGTCPQGSQQRAKQLSHIPLIRKKQVIVAKPSDKISPVKGDNKLPVDDQPRKNKSHLRTSNRIDSSSRLKRTVICSSLRFGHVLGCDLLENVLGCVLLKIIGCDLLKDKMADVNAPSGQTPTMAPPVRADDQILPHIRTPTSSGLLQLPPPYPQYTSNSSGIRSYNKKAGCYKCQLDEQWFDLAKETLREALQITPVNHNQAFVAPPSIDGLVDFVNQLGYPKLIMNLSNTKGPCAADSMGIITRTNIDYANRIWEEFTKSIHTFIKDKRNLSRHTSGKKRATLIVIPSIRFTKLIIHHLQRKHRFQPRPDSPLHLSNEDPVLVYLKFNAKGTKSEVFEMPIPDSLITVEIQQATYYREYLAKVTHHRKYLAGKTGGVQNPPTPKPTQPVKKPRHLQDHLSQYQWHQHSLHPHQLHPNHKKINASRFTETTNKPAKAKRIKHSISRKTRQPRSSLKSVGALKAEEVPAEEPHVADEDADYQKALEETMKDAYALPKGLLPPVVIREPESGKYQPLLVVPGKGKAKVTEEQVAHDLLSLQKHKKTSPDDQYIFQRRVSKPIGSSRHDESLYALLGQSDNEEESEKVVLGAKEGGQDEAQAGPDPDAQAEDQTGSNAGAQAEGQAGSNPNETSKGQAGSNPNETSKGQARLDPGNAKAKVQSISSPVVHAGSDREYIDLDIADVSPQPSTEQLDEGFTTTFYSNVQENLKLAVEEPVLLEEPASSSGTLTSL
nr:integrase, catalytic region, zinc finger, CCHC-type, peptidase aspartic, catalytic [Tanacetum cinerariifolium]